ncbi:winged helix-turn-helix transcriptional regulator [Paenibacillus sp. JNUCC31]|uniref:winged helix-turn-helix domain-containing protein n=1 Tax=Paenibacillus sp. JNUCC-31 TaxID=2777983 RepID=UPI00177F351A|nr:winged helix-turn-helix domain-containing protein [Paenibacillus sp. JNUCC-31]QOS81634.1 winged helix-turn-helix transcriptional regulator [Paenibacillus sp. JNUCC-31]
MSLQFDEGTYTVIRRTDSVRLLAKEFALLYFLYKNKEKAFTRSQLLDRVWPLEYPVERTVDDHVYRLRKKLRHWEEIVLDTVRGYGYRLTIRSNIALMPSNPSAQDQEMREAIHGLFRKYHLYGQGKSMLTLLDQQEVLGIEIDPFYKLYIHFIQGDLEWLSTTTEIPFKERLYCLLIFTHALIEPSESLPLYEKALNSSALSADQHRELRILNIVEVYAEVGQYERAKLQLLETYEIMESDKLINFKIPVKLSELYVELWGGSGEAVEEQLVVLRSGLRDAPYLREIGRFQVMEGLWLLRQGRTREAEPRMDDGLDVLKMTLNAPLYLNSAYQILLFMAHHRIEGRLQRKYRRLYAEISKNYGVPAYGQRIVSEIRTFLSPFTSSSDLPLI